MAATPDFFIVDGVQGRAGYERVATRLKRGFDASALLGPLPSRVSTLNTQYQAAWTSAMSTYQSQLAAAQAANQDASQPSPTTTTTVTYEPFEFDINKFLHTQDQLKVLMWKELPQ